MVKSKNRVVVNSNYKVSHPGQGVPKLRAVRPGAVTTIHNMVLAVSVVTITS